MNSRIGNFNLQKIKEYFLRLDRKSRIQYLVYFFCGIFFIPFLFWPAWIQRPFLSSKLQNLRSQIRAAQNQIQLEPALLQQGKKYAEEIDFTQKRLFSHNELQGILGILSNLAERSHIKLVGSQPEEQKQSKIPTAYENKYVSASYIISVEGGYHSLATFVSEMENYRKILRIEELTISPQEGKSGVHLGEMRISAFSSQKAGK